jgi:hypothetical protein
MQQSTALNLSNYQKAILTEMGISSWQLTEQENVEANQVSTSGEPNKVATLNATQTSAQPISQDVARTVSTDNALARLAAMKSSAENDINPALSVIVEPSGKADIPAPNKTSTPNILQTPVVELRKTDKVLLAINNDHPKFVGDVLLAIGLEDIELVSVTGNAIAEHVGYPLAWQQITQNEQGQEIKIDAKVLLTPPVVMLQNPKSKKQLWKAIQSFVHQQ